MVVPAVAAPSGLTVSATSDGFEVSWDDPGTDLGHELQYRSRGLQNWTQQVDAGFGTLDVEVRGLNPGVDYEAQVRAIDRSGTTSAWTPNSPFQVRSGLAPGAVSTVSATDSERDGIAVSWTSPAEPGSGVRGYTVEWTDRSPVGGRFVAQAQQDLPDTQTRYTIGIAGLVKGSPYWVRVVPFNQVGDGDPSEAVQAVATSPPGPVSALSIESDDEQLSLRWSPPLDGGGTDITGYGIRYQQVGTTSWSGWDHNGTGTSNAVTDLTNGQRYEVQVRAVNSSGRGPWLSEFAVPSLEALRPRGTQAAPAGRGITVSWQPPTKSGLTGYVVHWQTEPDQLHSQGAQQQSVPATETSVLLADLVAGVQYRVRLQSRFSDNSSGSSPDVLAAPVAEQSPLAAPSAVVFAVASEDRAIATTSPTNPVRLVVTSTAPTPAASQPAVLFREVQWKFQGAGTYAAENRVRIDDDSQRVDGFTLGQTYRLRVRAWNLDGPGAWHSVAGQSVLVAFTPDPPQLHTPTPADGQLALSWDAPSFTGGTAITGYGVRYSADSGSTWLDHSHRTTSTTTAISSLANGTTYTVEVKAINAVGDSDPGTDTATPRTTPDAPRSLALTADDEEIRVDWKAPAKDGGARIQSYKINYKPTTDTAFTAGPTVTPSSSDGPDATYRATISGLTNGTTYTVEVKAINAVGDSDPGTDTATPRTTPDAPRSLALTADDEEIRVDWKAPAKDGGARIQSYKINYKPTTDTAFTAGPTVTPSSSDGPDATYRATISGLTNGTTYTVDVKAINAVGDSDPGTETATPRTTPDAPRSLALTAGDEEVHVDWKAPAEDGGARIQSYKINYKQTTDTAFTAGPTVTPSSSDGPDATYRVTIDGLTNGTTYVVEVAATNIAGPGSPAEERATPLSTRNQVRQKVESVVTAHEGASPWLREAVEHLDDSGVTMSFLPAGGSTTGRITFICGYSPTDLDSCDLDSYGVKRAAAASTVIHELAHVHTHINRFEADPGTIAIAWLYIANAYGAGSGSCQIDELIADGLTDNVLPSSSYLSYWSVCASTGTRPTAAEQTVFAASVTGAIPDWLIDTYGGGTADKAAVWTEEYTGDTAAVWTDVMKLPTSPRTAVVRMMRNFFGRYCSVQIAEDAAFSNSGRASPWAAADCKPNPPTSVVLHRGATSLTLSWEPPETTPGGTATEYIVQWRSTDASDNEQYPDVTGTFGVDHRQVKATNLASLSYEMAGLTASKTYAVRVRADNASHASDWVESEGTVAVASAPQDFVVSAADGALSVSWSAPATNGGSAVAGYVLQWRAPGVTGEDTYSDTDRRAVITDLTDLTYSISSLTNGRSYMVRIYATTSLGNGAAAEAPATPGTPGTLSDVRVDPGTCSYYEFLAGECTYSFTVHWDHPTPGEGSGQISSFEIQWRPHDINNPDNALPWGTDAPHYGSVTVDDGTATSYPAQPENLSQTELRVRALNGSLPGPWSDVFKFAPGQPTHVQNLSAVYDSASGAFSVSWEPPRFTAGNPVTEYVAVLEDCTNGCFAIAFPGHFYQKVSLAVDTRSHTFTRTAAPGSRYIAYVYAVTQDGVRSIPGTIIDARIYLEF